MNVDEPLNNSEVDDSDSNDSGSDCTLEDEQEYNIIFGGEEPQHIMFVNIPYSGHKQGGEEKSVVCAVYNIVHEMLPPRLPTLLPPLNGPSPYEICDIPGKGRGIIATRDISMGEIVIVERPVLVCAYTITKEDIKRFARYVESTMDPDVWKNYNDLVNVKDASISPFIGIMETNAFEIGLVRGRESYNGVFHELSRLNHSCGPNLTRSWDPYLFTLSVQAVRPIRAGEELTIAYEDPCGQPHADRRYYLEYTYHFKCTCGYCTPASPTSDQIRFLAQGKTVGASLEDSYCTIVQLALSRERERRELGSQYARKWSAEISKSLALIMTEGIECVSALWHYLFLMKASGILGDEKGFKEWGFKAILHSGRYMNEQGEEGYREVEQWIDWVTAPETFPDWALFG